MSGESITTCMLTWSGSIISLFLHGLSFECTTKLCINFLNHFSVFFNLNSARHNLVIEFCLAFKITQFVSYVYLVNLRTDLWLLNDCFFSKMQNFFFLLNRALHIWLFFLKSVRKQDRFFCFLCIYIIFARQIALCVNVY